MPTVLLTTSFVVCCLACVLLAGEGSKESDVPGGISWLVVVFKIDQKVAKAPYYLCYMPIIRLVPRPKITSNAIYPYPYGLSTTTAYDFVVVHFVSHVTVH